MARRYSRDNKGRFAATGTGATARGGRLATAAGNKRATVTANLKGSVAGTVKKSPAPLEQRIDAARKAGRAKGLGIAAKTAARNKSLDAKANARGGAPGRGEAKGLTSRRSRITELKSKIAARGNAQALAGQKSAAVNYTRAQNVNKGMNRRGKGNAATRRSRR